MNRALTWICSVLFVVLAAGGGWLIIAPHVVGFQPADGEWTFATRADLVVGAVVIGVALLTLGGYLILNLHARMRHDT